jgi:hypothetical protein
VLLSKDESKETAWHHAAKGCQIETLKKEVKLPQMLQVIRIALKHEMLSKRTYDKNDWNNAAFIGDLEILKKLWYSAKEQHLKPEDLLNDIVLSTGVIRQTAWHLATEGEFVKILQRLWHWAKELQLKPEELKK